MATLHSHITLSLLPISSSSSSQTKKKMIPPPARDRIISFGKHKGRMLGTLPSKYLTWLSANLRAGDTLQWAELADEVLSDPYYKDRIEWEHAQTVLSGDNITHSSVSPVSHLLQLSTRFGWDNDDKAAWARVDFDLLGTSRGGRIPRINERDCDDDDGGGVKRDAVTVGGGGKRGERRERRKAKIMRNKMEGEQKTVSVVNPFPGRGALLDKIKRGRHGEEAVN